MRTLFLALLFTLTLTEISAPIVAAGPVTARPDCRSELQHRGAVVVSCVASGVEAVLMVGSYGRYSCRGGPDATRVIIQNGDNNNATCD